MTAATKSKRLVGKGEVLDRTGVTFVTLWRWMRAGTFPRSREVGGQIMWLESDIDDWISSLPVKRYKGDPQPRRKAVA